MAWKPVAVDGLVGVDDHVVSLPDADEDQSVSQGFRGTKSAAITVILCPSGPTLEVVVGGSIHEAQAVLLAFGKCDSIVLASSVGAIGWLDIGPVEEDVVGTRRSPNLSGRQQRSKSKCWRVEPVRDEHRLKVDVVVSTGRTIYHDRSDHAVAVLITVVAVVPCRTELSAEKRVCAALAWRQWTLGDGPSPIHRIGLPLSDAMPVNARAIGGEAVAHSNLNGVTPLCADRWTRILAVDGIDRSCEAVWRQSPVLDVKSVAHHSSCPWPDSVVVCIDAVPV